MFLHLNPFLLASLFILVSLVTSMCLFSVMFFICFLRFSNAVVCFFFQSNLFRAFVLFFDNSGLCGSESSANVVVNFVKRCIHPMIDMSCFNIFGISNLFIDSHLFFVGVIPVGVISYPNQVICFFGELTFL